MSLCQNGIRYFRGIEGIENLEKIDLDFLWDHVLMAGAQNEMGVNFCCRPPNHTGVEDDWLLLCISVMHKGKCEI